MKKLILSTFLLTATVACSGGSNNSSIDNKNLAGEWKVTHYSSPSEGFTVDTNNFDSDDYNTYIFTDNQLVIRTYDKKTGQKKYDVGPIEYKIEGNKIITVDINQQDSSFSMPDYRIVSLNSNQLKLDSIDDADSDPSDMILILSKVSNQAEIELESKKEDSDEKLIVSGSVDKEAIREVIKSHQKTINACYTKALSKEPNLEGKVVFEWTVVDSGKVIEAKVKTSTLNSSKVEKCILKKLKTWKFPAPPADQEALISYPMIFNLE